MGREFELKFRASSKKMEAIREKYGDFASITMETAYFDTPGRDLRARHWTFRRRLENGISVCTLKAPASGGARAEWETECENIADAPEKLIAMGAPEELKALTKEGVEPVCGAKFTRLAKTLVLESCTVELALDSGILQGGNRMELLREVEVECKSGSEEAAMEFALSLAREFFLLREPESKYKRALRLRETQE